MAINSIFEDERRKNVKTGNPLGALPHSASRQIMGAHGQPITIICDGMSAEEAENRIRGAAAYYTRR